MTAFRVDSEVGRLRKVLVHRPGLSLQRLTPSNASELLFDDVLWVRKAGEQHDEFVELLQDRDVEVLLLEELLAETLEESEAAKSHVLDTIVHELTVGLPFKHFSGLLSQMPAHSFLFYSNVAQMPHERWALVQAPAELPRFRLGRPESRKSLVAKDKAKALQRRRQQQQQQQSPPPKR